MAQPTVNAVHVDAVLTNISVAYLQDQSHFIATRVFPVIPVEKKSDVYFTYTKNDWFRDEAQLRSGGTESAGSGYGLSTAAYECKVYALHKDLDDQTLQNADAPLNLQREASEFLTQRMLLRQEIQWVSDYFTTSVWGTDKTGGTDFTVWSDYAASDPIEDIELGKETILSTTGRMANTLVVGYQVWRQLKHHPDVVDRYKYTRSEAETADVLRNLFEIENIHVAMAVKATNVEAETAAYAFTHGKHAMLCHVAPNPGLLTPSAGYIFSWTGISDGLGESIGVSRFPMPHLRSERVEAQIAFDDKVVATDLGYFFSGAVA